eukprot:COSAG01_NODE_3715_length_5769_cov_2.903175_6_plen_53_part_00
MSCWGTKVVNAAAREAFENDVCADEGGGGACVAALLAAYDGDDALTADEVEG